MALTEVNYLAVLVAGILAYGLGSMWYSPLMFAKIWMRETKMSMDDLKKAKKKGMALTFIASFLATLVMSYAMAIVIGLTALKGPINGLFIAFLIWFGFVGNSMLNGVFWENKSFTLYAITSAHALAILSIMGIIIGVWQ